jgi:PIN domain nuclease of toxin-antitoxin system
MGGGAVSSIAEAKSQSQVLLDTHALVWLLQGNERLGSQSRSLVASAAKESAGVLVAAISVWEVSMLVAKGRLALDRDVAEWIAAALALPGLRLAPLEPQIAIDATRLPGDLHGDPADRLIVATARHHGATLVTDDQMILAYSDLGHLRAHRAST